MKRAYQIATAVLSVQAFCVAWPAWAAYQGVRASVEELAKRRGGDAK